MPISRRAGTAALALACLVLLAPLARAQDGEPDPPTADGPKTVVKYASCAMGLAFSTNIATGLSALSLCVKIFLDEFN